MTAAHDSSVRTDAEVSDDGAPRRTRLPRVVAQRLWPIGQPARWFLVSLIRLYRVALGPAFGGRCRFYPSCSVYAEQAIRELGVVRGVVLAAWRIVRCSPLSRGGIDHPPRRPVAGGLQPVDADGTSEAAA